VLHAFESADKKVKKANTKTNNIKNMQKNGSMIGVYQNQCVEGESEKENFM